MKFMKTLRQLEIIVFRHKQFLKIAVIASIFLLSFFHIDRDDVTICPFKLATGLPCPGCGLSHSIISISHGNFIEAVNQHLLGPIVYLFLIIILFKTLIELILKKDIVLLSKSVIYKSCYAFAFVLCVYHAIRIINLIYTDQVPALVHKSIIYFLIHNIS